MGRGYIVLAILLLGIALLALNWNGMTTTVMPPPGSKPLFLGYISNTTRIDAVNLTELTHTAQSMGYEVTSGHGTDEWVEGYVPASGCRLVLTYATSSNYTYFQFSFPEKSNATDWLWILLQDSLSLDEVALEDVKRNALSNYQVDALGPHFGAYIDGVKPDWAIVAKYLGSQVKMEDEWVGIVRYTYDSGASMILNSEAVIIKKSVADRVVCSVEIDSDFDIRLDVDSNEKLSDPAGFYVQIFSELGLPQTALSRLKLEEDWAYPL